MAKVPGKTTIYELADKFLQNCLVEGRSLIWPTEPSWSIENINGLDHLIMGNPDIGERDFFAKLHDQLSAASDDIHRVGTPLGTVHALLGHSSAEITRAVYLHSLPAGAREAVEELRRF